MNDTTWIGIAPITCPECKATDEARRWACYHEEVLEVLRAAARGEDVREDADLLLSVMPLDTDAVRGEL